MRHLARRNELPESDEKRHDHRLARAAASVGRSRHEPSGQGAVLLKPEKTPSQLDHAAPDASIAGTRKTFLAPAAAALVWGAGKASVAGDGPAIAQVPRENLVERAVSTPTPQTRAMRRIIACGPLSSAPPRTCAGARAPSRVPMVFELAFRSSSLVLIGSTGGGRGIGPHRLLAYAERRRIARHIAPNHCQPRRNAT